MTAPAWGTPPAAADERREYVVVGFYNENGQTWRFRTYAQTAREAQQNVLREEAEREGEPLVVDVLTVVDGEIRSVRDWTAYLLDDDPRNKKTG